MKLFLFNSIPNKDVFMVRCIVNFLLIFPKIKPFKQ